MVKRTEHQRKILDMLDDMIDEDQEDGPTIMETEPSGTIRWTMNGMNHRMDGPAVIRSDGETWCQYGDNHREDGPAVIWTDDDDEWYVHGDPINSYEELQDTTGCTDEDLVAMKLRWGAIVPQF